MDEFNKKTNYTNNDAVDLDTLLTQGIHNITNAVNAPGSDTNGTLIVTTQTNNTQQIWQTSSSFFTRKHDGTSWGVWAQYGAMVFDGESLFITL